MKKRFKRVLTLLLSLLVLFSLLAGCEKEEADVDETGSGNQTSEIVEGEQELERMKITYAAFTTGPHEKNSLVERKIEEMFPDIDIEFWGFERATWKDQLNTRVAGGDIPDIYQIPDFSNYHNQGLLAPIPLDKLEEFCPGYYQALQSCGQRVWIQCVMDGKLYRLPQVRSDTPTATDGWRSDWLENVGITKVPETIDEMEIAFRKFVEDDPDGNGKKDTYGFSARGKDGIWMAFSSIFAAHGVFPHMMAVQPDGTLKSGIITQQAKQALTVLQKWYKEGLLDAEFVTTDNKILTQKWANGKMGFIEGTWNRFIPGGPFYDALIAVNEDAEISMAPPVKGPEGKSGYFAWNNVGGDFGFGTQVGNDPEKMEKLLRLIEKFRMDVDFNIFVVYGEENVNYTRDPETNQFTFIPPYDMIENRGSMGTSSCWPAPMPEVWKQTQRSDLDELTKCARASTLKVDIDFNNWANDLVDWSEISEKREARDQVRDKWVINFIIGEKSMDEFDQFVKEWEDAGGALGDAMINDAFEAALEKLEEME